MANELVIFIGRNILIGVNALMGQLDIGVNVRVLFKGMHVCVGFVKSSSIFVPGCMPCRGCKKQGPTWQPARAWCFCCVVMQLTPNSETSRKSSGIQHPTQDFWQDFHKMDRQSRLCLNCVSTRHCGDLIQTVCTLWVNIYVMCATREVIILLRRGSELVICHSFCFTACKIYVCQFAPAFLIM